jgi:hypothetical protein
MNKKTRQVKIILSAFNIHAGGGLVLLSSLFQQTKIKKFILDFRIKKKINNSKKNIFIKRKIFDRLFYFHSNIFNSKSSHIICFNNLPPLFKSKSRVILFIQTFYFFANILNYNFNLYTTLRIYFEKIWFKIGIRNVDEIWIQTPTMKKRLILYLKKLNLKNKIEVKEKPMIDVKLQSLIKSNIKSKKFFSNTRKKNYFFYPADSAGHKNHKRLFLAFSKVNKPFKLFLTIDDKSFKNYLRNIEVPAKGKFINLNTLPRYEVLNFFKNKINALIFPSLDESFGIPLIEACVFKKNILVSNKNYAHDLIENAIYFNPYKVTSITNSINKYLNKNAKIKKPKLKKDLTFLSAEKFIEDIN